MEQTAQKKICPDNKRSFGKSTGVHASTSAAVGASDSCRGFVFKYAGSIRVIPGTQPTKRRSCKTSCGVNLATWKGTPKSQTLMPRNTDA